MAIAKIKITPAKEGGLLSGGVESVTINGVEMAEYINHLTFTIKAPEPFAFVTITYMTHVEIDGEILAELEAYAVNPDGEES